MAAIFISVPVGAAAAEIFQNKWWFIALAVAGLCAAVFAIVNSPLQPAQRRARAIVGIFALPVLGWLALEAFRVFR